MARFAVIAALLPSLVASLATRQDCAPGGPQPPEGWTRFADTSIEIQAPTSTIWDLLTDVGGWKDWNDVFSATKINGKPEVGKLFWISSYMRTAPLMLRRTSVLMKLTVVEENRKVCWAPQGLPGIRGEHCYVLCPTAEGTQVYNYEDHRGTMQPVTKKVMGEATTDAFASYNTKLRTEAARVR